MPRHGTFEIDDDGNVQEPTDLPAPLKAAESLLQRSEDLQGLSTPEQRTAPLGDAESARSLVLMQRVALVFADVTDDRGIYEKLETAGCPPEIYFQMREMPEFKMTLHKALTDYIVLPRAGKMLAAMTKAATLGDARAFSKAMDFANFLSGSSIDEMADDMARITDEDAYAREVFNTLEDVKQLVEDLGLKAEEEDAQAKAREAVRKVEKPKRTRLVDHAAVRQEELKDGAKQARAEDQPDHP